MIDAAELVSRLTEEEAQAVLLFLCRDDETCQTIDSITATLRHANRIFNTTSAVICIRCEAGFTIEENGCEACIYHTGLYSFWPHADTH